MELESCCLMIIKVIIQAKTLVDAKTSGWSFDEKRDMHIVAKDWLKNICWIEKEQSTYSKYLADTTLIKSSKLASSVKG